jgi:hypothetical protein
MAYQAHDSEVKENPKRKKCCMSRWVHDGPWHCNVRGFASMNRSNTYGQVDHVAGESTPPTIITVDTLDYSFFRRMLQALVKHCK